MKSTGARFSNELQQKLDFMTGYQKSSPINGCWGAWPITEKKKYPSIDISSLTHLTFIVTPYEKSFLDLTILQIPYFDFFPPQNCTQISHNTWCSITHSCFFVCRPYVAPIMSIVALVATLVTLPSCDVFQTPMYLWWKPYQLLLLMCHLQIFCVQTASPLVQMDRHAAF